MRIALRHDGRLMAEQLLHLIEIDAGLYQPRGEGMPEIVGENARHLVLLSIVPHQPKDEQLGVVIPSDLTKPDRCAVELKFAKERPLRRQRIPGAGDEVKSRTDLEIRLATL